MATGDKKRAVMTTDINNSGSSYPVMPLKTIDQTPTAGNTDHLISSAGVKSALTGVGGDAVLLDSSNDLNSNLPSGFYRYVPSSPPQNAPTGFGYTVILEVITFGTNNWMQRAYSTSDTASEHGLIVQRSRFGTKTTPWEWVNPPMVNDVEYRTIQRVAGSIPVYARRISGQVMPNGRSTVAHGVSSISSVIRVEAHMSEFNGVAFPLIMPNTGESTVQFSTVSADSANLYFYNSRSAYVDHSVIVDIYYTKS